jgi:hypothetical protein
VLSEGGASPLAGQNANPAACDVAPIAERTASRTQGSDKQAREIARKQAHRPCHHPPAIE